MRCVRCSVTLPYVFVLVSTTTLVTTVSSLVSLVPLLSVVKPLAVIGSHPSKSDTRDVHAAVPVVTVEVENEPDAEATPPVVSLHS